MAFAAVVQAPPVANYGLALISRARLTRSGLAFEIYPNAFGQSLVFLVTTPEEAQVVVERIQRTLSQRVREEELDKRFFEQVTEQFGSGRNPSPGELSVSHCSGELYRDARQAVAITDRATMVRWLEDARQQAYSQENARFAVVGSARVSVAVRSALGSVTPWPRGKVSSGESSTAPGAPTLAVSTSQDTTLSAAWFTGSLKTAISAWRTLRDPKSVLVSQLSAMDVDWHLESVSAVARPTGACLRIDLSHPTPPTPQAWSDLRRVMRLVIQETQVALTNVDDTHPTPLSSLLGSDPRLTARRAAWQSLSLTSDDRVPTLRANLSTPVEPGPELQADVLVQPKPSTIEYRFASAKGEVEHWMLVGSRCAALAESVQNSGATATWLRAVARKLSGNSGVTLEPWISDDGIGLFAHGVGTWGAETRESTARRVANALGSAVSSGKIDGSELAFAREDSILQVGAEPRRAWNLLIEGLTSRKPSALEPLGNVTSLRYLSVADLVASRRRWFAGPLRAAAIVSGDGLQASVMSAPLSRWLEPHRLSKGACERREPPPTEQETAISTYSPDELDANAYIAFRLNEAEDVGDSYHEWLEWSLNRRGGWLETLLIETGNAKAARAYVRGPNSARVLIIELFTADESAASLAVERTRLFLADVARAGVSAAELGPGLRWAEHHSLESAMDPRSRLVRLWLGAALSPPTTAGFTKYLKRALESAPVTIMRVRK